MLSSGSRVRGGLPDGTHIVLDAKQLEELGARMQRELAEMRCFRQLNQGGQVAGSAAPDVLPGPDYGW